MIVARRHFMASSALGAVGPRRWEPGRLGYNALITPAAEKPARTMLHTVRAAGCRRIQLNFWWGEPRQDFLKRLPGWVRSAGLKLEAVSAYVNCCSPETVIMRCKYDLPGPLEGDMNYPMFAELIHGLPSGTPITIEHISVEQFEHAKRRLDSLFERAI